MKKTKILYKMFWTKWRGKWRYITTIYIPIDSKFDVLFNSDVKITAWFQKIWGWVRYEMNVGYMVNISDQTTLNMRYFDVTRFNTPNGVEYNHLFCYSNWDIPKWKSFSKKLKYIFLGARCGDGWFWYVIQKENMRSLKLDMFHTSIHTWHRDMRPTKFNENFEFHGFNRNWIVQLKNKIHF